MIKKKLSNQCHTKILEKFKSGAGFTLIELLVVMAIIGVLASLILLNIQSSLGRARDAQRKNDLKQIQTALQLYHNDYGHYPLTNGWTNSNTTNPSYPFWIPGLTASYIKTMPVDPKNSGCNTYNFSPVDDPGNPNCFAYAYYSGGWCDLGGANDGYILTTRLEQYQGSDLSQKPIYKSDGTFCSNWYPSAVSGIYTVSNP